MHQMLHILDKASDWKDNSSINPVHSDNGDQVLSSLEKEEIGRLIT
jgi:hypothetical protein